MKQWMALALYDLAMTVLSPLIWLRFKWRARAEPLYGERLTERWARYGFHSSGGRLWIHAVSLGETLAARPLIEALRVRRPRLRILLTHGTATGRETGTTLLGEHDRQVWLPVDTAVAMRRFFQHHKPEAGVLMETEIWPNAMCEAERFGVPMVLANARLSPRSLRRGLRLAALMRPAARRLSLVLAQTPGDAERLRQAGAPRPVVCGNLKFDLNPDLAALSIGANWYGALQASDGARTVVLAAVWREGEDAPLLEAWNALPRTRRPLLVLVPRHPQRFDEVAAAVQAAGLTLSRRSQWAGGLPDEAACRADVWLGDSMREMGAYYALSDVVLLGGSWAPLGGQNLIEAAACGRIVVMGPHTFNFDEAACMAEAAGAARRADNLRAGVQEALRLISPEYAAERAERQAAASDFATVHRGAAARMAEQILDLIEGRRG